MQSYKGNLYLIDYANVFHRSLAGYRDLSFEGVSTGAMYGFYRTLVRTVSLYGPGKFVVCEDRRPYIRSEWYEGYKAKRNKDFDQDILDMVDQSHEMCRDLLDVMGIQREFVQGFEADDLIALMHGWHRYKFEGQTVALSNDSDLKQLLNENNFAISKSSNQGRKASLYTERKFIHEHKMIPRHWVQFIAITGSHNDIPGIRGLGPVKALDIIRSRTKSKYYRVFKKNEAIVGRNIRLIRLPMSDWQNYISDALPLRKLDGGSTRDVVRHLSRFGVNVQVYDADHLDAITNFPI